MSLKECFLDILQIYNFFSLFWRVIKEKISDQREYSSLCDGFFFKIKS